MGARIGQRIGEEEQVAASTKTVLVIIAHAGAATKHALSEAEENIVLCGREILHPPPADSE